MPSTPLVAAELPDAELLDAEPPRAGAVVAGVARAGDAVVAGATVAVAAAAPSRSRSSTDTVAGASPWLSNSRRICTAVGRESCRFEKQRSSSGRSDSGTADRSGVERRMRCSTAGMLSRPNAAFPVTAYTSVVAQLNTSDGGPGGRPATCSGDM
jgi:hypothetical protein